MTKPMTDEAMAQWLIEGGESGNDAFFSASFQRDLGKRIRRLREELSEERHFCICGCPMDEHENYGEDGFGCDKPNHECVLVCAAAAEIAKSLRKENERLKSVLLDVVNQACWDNEEKRFDSWALTAYAEGLELLDEFCLVKIKINVGRRVIAVVPNGESG